MGKLICKKAFPIQSTIKSKLWKGSMKFMLASRRTPLKKPFASFFSALLFLCGCAEKEPNPDIRHLLDLATADSQYDELYQTFKENIRTPNVSVAKYREKRGELRKWGAREFNPKVPGATTFDKMIVVRAAGTEWTCKAKFYFTETNSLVAVGYEPWFRMPEPEIKPIDWHMKWSIDETAAETNAVNKGVQQWGVQQDC